MNDILPFVGMGACAAFAIFIFYRAGYCQGFKGGHKDGLHDAWKRTKPESLPRDANLKVGMTTEISNGDLLKRLVGLRTIKYPFRTFLCDCIDFPEDCGPLYLGDIIQIRATTSDTWELHKIPIYRLTDPAEILGACDTVEEAGLVP